MAQGLGRSTDEPFGGSGITDVTGRINAIVNDFFKTARGRELSESIGMQSLGGTPDDMAALMAHDIERLGPIVRGANITMD